MAHCLTHGSLRWWLLSSVFLG
uniref:Uncharacterized protein n=1 Tax=Rhizophora mucronata TaxID=61149 RepID=A0A2P2NPW2_RHIMU